MSEAAASLEPFGDRAQKVRADTLGMFVFLASEVMLFGGLFAAMGVYRIAHPLAAAQAAAHLNLWLGTANTAILLTSSLLVALAVLAATAGRRRPAAGCLLAAAALGVAFLVVKGFEYHAEYAEGLMPRIGPPSPLGQRPATLFVSLYFVSTALHAIHVGVGILLLGGTGLGVLRGRVRLPAGKTTVALMGLYWHLVDVIWIFLFPMLYLARV
jgi:cytochrome c oxidase subunit 3